MADDEKTIWNDAAGAAPTGTSTSRWASVLGESEAEAAPSDVLEVAMAPKPEQAPHKRRGLGGLWRQLDAGAQRFSLAYILVILGWVFISEDEIGPRLFGGNLEPLIIALFSGAAAAVLTTLALERYDKDARRGWLEFAAPLAMTVVLVAVGYALDGSDHEALAGLFDVGVFGASALGSIWLLYTDDNDSALFAELVRCIGFAFLLSLLVTVGLLICTLAWDELLGLEPLISFDILVISAWTLLFPILLLSQLPHHDETPTPGKVYRAVAGYVVLPLCLVLLAILYGYIVRILIEGHMPSGQMNWFGSFALFIEICLWLGLRPIENRVARFFVRWGWLLLVPVVCVQAYGVWVRFCAYGLTSARFAGMVCLAVGFFALVMAAWQQRPRLLFAVAAVACAVVTLTPANIVDIPNLQQASRLSAAMADGDDEQLYSSWDYLRYSGRGYLEPRLPEGVTLDSSFEEEFGHSPEVPVESSTWCVWSTDVESLDVSGFSRVYTLDRARRVEGNGDPVTLYRCEWDDGTQVEIDLGELIEWLPEDGYEGMAPADLTVDLDDGSRLVFTWIEADSTDGAINYVYVSGWYLVP